MSKKFSPNIVGHGHGGASTVLHTTKDERVYIDPADYPLVKNYRWYVGPNGYVCTHVGKKRTTIYLGRLLAKARKNERVYYVDGDPLNNSRENLRKCVVLNKARG